MTAVQPRKASLNANFADKSEEKHKACQKKHSCPVILASKLTLAEIQHLLDFQYRPGRDKHRWDLHKNGERRLHELVVNKINKVQTADCGTLERAIMMTDALLDDQLLALKSKENIQNHLLLAKSDQVFFRSADCSLEITGFPDRAIGFKPQQGDMRMVVVIRTATPISFAATMTELFFYLYGMFDLLAGTVAPGQRKTFGFVTDSVSFQFAMIGPDRVLRVSEKLNWVSHQQLILDYLDHGIEDVLLAGCRAAGGVQG